MPFPLFCSNFQGKQRLFKFLVTGFTSVQGPESRWQSGEKLHNSSSRNIKEQVLLSGAFLGKKLRSCLIYKVERKSRPARSGQGTSVPGSWIFLLHHGFRTGNGPNETKLQSLTNNTENEMLPSGATVGGQNVFVFFLGGGGNNGTPHSRISQRVNTCAESESGLGDTPVPENLRTNERQ